MKNACFNKNNQKLKFFIKKLIFDKKKPPDANASTQERQTNSKSVKTKPKRTRKDKDTKVTPRPFLLQASLPEPQKNKYLIFQKESYMQILIFNTPDSRNLKKH